MLTTKYTYPYFINNTTIGKCPSLIAQCNGVASKSPPSTSTTAPNEIKYLQKINTSQYFKCLCQFTYFPLPQSTLGSVACTYVQEITKTVCSLFITWNKLPSHLKSCKAFKLYL